MIDFNITLDERHAKAVKSAIDGISSFLTKEQMLSARNIDWHIKDAKSSMKCLSENPDALIQYSAYIADLQDASKIVAAETLLKKKISAYYADRTRQLISTMTMLGFPDRHAGLSFPSWLANTQDQESSIRSVYEWASSCIDGKNRARSVLMFGPPGTGKTHLATAAATYFSLTGFSVAYSTAADIVRHIRSTYDSGSGLSEKEAFEKFTYPALLVMDEVGVGKDSDFSRETLHTIISKRYDMKRPTIFITNASAKDFRAAIMERAWDRLQEDGVIQLKMVWDSFRSAPRTGESLFKPPFPQITKPAIDGEASICDDPLPF